LSPGVLYSLHFPVNAVKRAFLSSGWMEQKLFYQWFEQIFLQKTKTLPRPLLLIVDGYGSHFAVETLKLALINNV